MEQQIEFRQDPHFSLESFFLTQETLAIRQKSMGLQKERVLKLVDLVEVPDVLFSRFPRFYVVPLLFAACSAGIGWFIINKNLGPAILALIPAVFAAAFVWHAALGFKPTEVLAFRSKTGGVLFKLYRPRKAAWRYEEFAAKLRGNINAAQLAQLG